jgi:hypothetical protein
MLRTLALVAVMFLVAGGPTSAEEPAPTAPGGVDRIEARKALLRRLHHQADEAAGLAHLAARVAADEALPLPYLGLDAEADAQAGGMRVTRVYPATAAQEMGIEAKDVILAVDGKPTPSEATLGLAIRSRAIGSRIALRIRRAAEELTLHATLGQRPEDNDDEEEAVPTHGDWPSGDQARALLTFNAAPAGPLPASMDVLLGGHGDEPRWHVMREGENGWIRQSAADATGIRYPMAWAAEFHARDVEARVRFRLVGGRQDRAAGLVVRGQDRWTYIVARVNGAEGDLNLYRCAHGRRQLLPGGEAKVSVDDGAWHVLEVRAQGARITATVDRTTEVTSHDTYVRGWHVGLWTKSDSVTDFDDFAARGLPPEGPR